MPGLRILRLGIATADAGPRPIALGYSVRGVETERSAVLTTVVLAPLELVECGRPDQRRACGTPHLCCADKTTLLRPVILAL